MATYRFSVYLGPRGWIRESGLDLARVIELVAAALRAQFSYEVEVEEIG